MVHPPEKLSNDHAHDAQACGPANQTPQGFEYISQLVIIGQIESTADILVKRFAQPSAFQSAIASTSAVLQSADEMEMTELHYRAWPLPSRIMPETSSETEARIRLCIEAGMVVNA